jgi:hypothetical protein
MRHHFVFTSATDEVAHLTGFSAENRQKRRCLFRTVPLTRAGSGTKMGKKAYFCYRLLQPRE